MEDYIMDATLLGILKEKQFIAIIKSAEYKQLLSQMCLRIVKSSKNAPNEATVEFYFESELFSFFRNVFGHIGFSYSPIKEKVIATERHTAKGRADTVSGAFILEFKQPSTLNTSSDKSKAVEQISEYIEGLENKNDTPVIGFISDGIIGCFVTKSNGVIHAEPFLSLTGDVLDRVVQNIISLNLIALSSKNLVDSFCNPPENDGVAFGLLNALYSALSKMADKTKMLFIEWKELFNLAHDDTSKQQAILNRKESLGNLVGERFSDNNNEYKALFALQTAYAVIVKIIAYRVVSLVRYSNAFADFEVMKLQPHDAMRVHLAELEEGAIFRQYGIANLLEGDFFSWYCTTEQWTPEIAERIIEIYSILSQYADKAVLNKTEQSQDFFKALYEVMIPSAVRHSLGEFYTKKWLARKVVKDALELASIDEWRGIDPCCGSGTFLTAMIDIILHEYKDSDVDTVLNAVLHRVKGIDLNPVAVLTARVNYFINISHLLQDNREIEIPVYLGDSSYLPVKVQFDGVNCLEYVITTLQQPINIVVPESIVKDSLSFSNVMTSIEVHIKNEDIKSAYDALLSLVTEADATDLVKKELYKLSTELIELERKDWDGIWARIISNFLITANLGRFDIIVGNPPWVDWKNLPSGYREKIKALCISRKMFSGDRLVGGISLDICALIANVSAENWLSDNGILAFLMPEKLVLQQSYEGFRNLFLSDERKLYFRKFSNWTKSGHPFSPVTEKFYTYFISHIPLDYADGVETEWFVLKKGKRIEGIEELDISEFYTQDKKLMATCHSTRNVFTRIDNHTQIAKFQAIAGSSDYIGREGIEFYPQELMVFTLSGLPTKKECTALINIQVKKSKYRVPQKPILLETEYLHPLIKGVDIIPFHVNISGNIVPFPYNSQTPRVPISISTLAKHAPNLARFYQANIEMLLAQSNYSDRIIGKNSEYHALARVGAYSFAKNYVVFRDNSKWGAAVIANINTSWGGVKRPVFQNHAVSICEDRFGNLISLNEAHYICGILNSPIASQYTIQSSDSRSFPIRPRIAIPKYNPKSKIHLRIVALSKRAHKYYDSTDVLAQILDELDELYLNLAGYRKQRLIIKNY
jgi:hypothetical protein